MEIVTKKELKSLVMEKKINGIQYKPFRYKIFKNNKKNFWIELMLEEGKNREIRELMRSINLQVNKLIRVEFGPFKLANLKIGDIALAEKKEIQEYENYFGKI